MKSKKKKKKKLIYTHTKKEKKRFKKKKKKEIKIHSLATRPPTHDPRHARPLVHRNAHEHAFPACIHYSLLYVHVINS